MTITTLAPGETAIWRIVQVVRQLIALLQGSWTSYTATLTPAAGAITTQASNSAYKQVGKTVYCRIDILVTTAGTASGSLTLNLPVVPVAGASQAAVGRESAITGFSIAFRIKPGLLASAGLVNYDGTDTAIANSSHYEFNITYEAA